MVVNEEQAVTICRIFFMFSQGYTAHSISKILTEEGIPSPHGCEVWYARTIQSILQNEKYKGDALLQKEFTVDFLTRKLKKTRENLLNTMSKKTTSRLSARGFMIMCRNV